MPLPTQTRYPDAATVEAEFLASAHATWAGFAREKGWDAADSRVFFQVTGKWIRAKRAQLASHQLEGIAEAVFSHRTRWHADVLRTLKEYPEVIDSAMQLLKLRVNEYIGYAKNNTFSAVPTEDLESLSRSIKTLVDAKHRSLLIDHWAFREAENLSTEDPEKLAEKTDRTVKTKSGWTVSVMGMGKLTGQDMAKLCEQYYDRPAVPGADARVVNPPETEEEETGETLDEGE